MTKRILALVMAVLFALTCSVMVACSNTTTAPEEETSSPAGSETGKEESKSEAPVVSEKPSNDASEAPVVSDEPSEEPSEEPSSPEDEVTEPTPMYSTEWLDWLTNVDMGDTYPMVYSGGLYGGMKYGPTEEDKANQSPSAFELWPYTAGDLSTVGENAHFHMCLTMDSSEFDGTPGIGTEDYGYKWVVYYREIDSTDDYIRFEGAPWGAITYGDNYLYRFDVYSAGFKPSLKDGGTNTYHMIFIILDASTDELVIWRDEMVDWTDSSELYLADAITAGKITKHAD
ncbi:MAG: hypothetical protein IJX08_05720 [Clostridia bacterium]|nr:hypothetical protein [Clostridia bacterium]MBQ8399453.1 hypothetical protein [Clostridia bacterium]